MEVGRKKKTLSSYFQVLKQTQHRNSISSVLLCLLLLLLLLYSYSVTLLLDIYFLLQKSQVIISILPKFVYFSPCLELQSKYNQFLLLMFIALLQQLIYMHIFLQFIFLYEIWGAIRLYYFKSTSIIKRIIIGYIDGNPSLGNLSTIYHPTNSPREINHWFPKSANYRGKKILKITEQTWRKSLNIVKMRKIILKIYGFCNKYIKVH